MFSVGTPIGSFSLTSIPVDWKIHQSAFAQHLGQSRKQATVEALCGIDPSNDGIYEAKVTAERDEDFVVFQIGMRINNFWKIHRWLPILLVAPRIVRELVADSDSGLLGTRTVFGPRLRNIGFIQYWDSFESLRDYARDGDQSHYPAWQQYYRDGTKEDAAVGIWHETYLVTDDDYETVYNNMPAHGLAACNGTEITHATEQRKTATGRLDT